MVNRITVMIILTQKRTSSPRVPQINGGEPRSNDPAQRPFNAASASCCGHGPRSARRQHHRETRPLLQPRHGYC